MEGCIISKSGAKASIIYEQEKCKDSNATIAPNYCLSISEPIRIIDIHGWKTVTRYFLHASVLPTYGCFKFSPRTRLWGYPCQPLSPLGALHAHHLVLLDKVHMQKLFRLHLLNSASPIPILPRS